jgi:AraC family transcriptional regulator of adaptative response / DNA-3-methyladenine glycosylase II
MLSPKECEQARLSRDARFDGVFFVLVNTTGIFCRNTCKVRLPLEKNVDYAFSAQQAIQSGFRPCLRCRPDSAPNSFAWQGVNTTLNRAIKLLSQRLDYSIEAIAGSLGISSRYLNKLFQEKLQMSPKRFRIYQQVLMAKNLLQQTQLSIENVAESVGFSSARQLQQHVKTHLRLTPSQLRNHDALSAEFNEQITVFLAYRPPYNWPQVRDFFKRRAITGNEFVFDDGFTKILNIEAELSTTDEKVLNTNAEAPEQKPALSNTLGTIAIATTVKHQADKNGFSISFNAAFSKHTLAIISLIRRMLDVDADIHLIKKGLISAGLNEQEIVSGLRIPGVADEFEAVCRAILGQQVSVTAAINNVNKLHAHFADKQGLALESGFVSPQHVAQDDLLFLKMPAKRRQTLIDVARYFVESRKLQHTLHNKSEFVKNLIDIKGIGPWTINYVELRALGDTDIWLDSDLIIKQQKAKFTQQGRTLIDNKAAPWRSYLTLNLWSIS